MYKFLILIRLIHISHSQLISPCPRLFKYEPTSPSEPDRWYGVVTLISETDLNGVWLRLIFNKQSIQLGNWFGEVATTDNKDYLIKNRRHKLQANVPYTIRFYIRYNPNDAPPELTMFRLNAMTICPETDIRGGFPTTELPQYQPIINADNVACGTVVNAPRPLITRGQVAHEGEFPWHAALYHVKGIDITYICGASLISKNHLITVAHCVTKRKTQQPLDPEALIIYLGKYYLKRFSNPGIQDKNVEKITVHPQYNAQTFNNDIAIIRMTTPAEITNYVRPICLWSEDVDLQAVIDKVGTVVGWGFDENGRITEQLTKAQMPVVAQETCIYSFPDFYSRFTSTQTYCAGFKNGTTVCNGDSGGGMVFPKRGSSPNNPIWQLRGLVGIGVALQNQLGCDQSHYAVFTDVAKHLHWINTALD